MPNNTITRANLSNNGAIRNIHYGDVLIKFGSVLSIRSDDIPFIKNTDTVNNNVFLKNGDIVIADTAEDETVGKVTEIFDIDTEKVVSGLHTIPCRPKKNFAPKFLGYYMNSPAYHYQLFPLMQGVKVLSISKSNIVGTVIHYPDILQQTKITNLLSLIDKKISVQRQLVEALKKYKRGLINEILSERVKLSADKWITCRIGDFLCPKSVKQLPSEDAPLMAFTSTSGVCEKGERYDRGFLVKDVTTKMYKRTDYGDFIYSSNNIDVGSIGLNLYGAAVISDVYEIFSIRYADPWFISETIQQKKVIHNILKYRQGCLYGQYRIYAEDFMSVHIRVPTLNIQKKIGSIFSQINRRITSEQNLLYLLEKIRASLLQQLFI